MIRAGIQADLFSPSPRLTVRTPPVSGSDFSYKARRDDGISRAQAHAETDVPDWTDIAARYVADYAVRVAQGQPFLMEDAREASIGRVPSPDEPRAWGAVGPYAARKGWIEKVAYAPARSSNGSPKWTWRAIARP